MIAKTLRALRNQEYNFDDPQRVAGARLWENRILDVDVSWSTDRRKRNRLTILPLIVLVGACVDTRTMTIDGYGGVGISSNGSSGSEALSEAPTAVDPLQVRAPEIFKASATARWNGSRTSRGVWVAHPDVKAPMQVRIVNAKQKLEVDGIVYRQRGSAAGDVLTVSSDAASALGMKPNEQAQLAIFALRPANSASRQQRTSAEGQAYAELASYIARMPENEVLQLVAAALRGMGYATTFEPSAGTANQPSIRAFSDPDASTNLPSIRVAVRPGLADKISAAEIADLQAQIARTGDLGVVVSVAGFAPGAEQALQPGTAHIELVDLDGLMNIWITHYEQLSEPDRALLRLQPVYFLAGG